MPQLNLTTKYTVYAAHQLKKKSWSEAKNKKVFGNCSSVHGHEYKIEISVTGVFSEETGMIINGYDLDKIVKKKIFSQMDHKYLNTDIPFFKTHLPTAEWISIWVFQELKNAFPKNVTLKKVRIYETGDLYAEYTEN